MNISSRWGVRERRAIIAETALRLGKALRTTAQFWFNLQRMYELRKEEEEGSSVYLRGIRPLKELQTPRSTPGLAVCELATPRHPRAKP
jgi:antitoxin HigA-1